MKFGVRKRESWSLKQTVEVELGKLLICNLKPTIVVLYIYSSSWLSGTTSSPAREEDKAVNVDNDPSADTCYSQKPYDQKSNHIHMID